MRHLASAVLVAGLAACSRPVRQDGFVLRLAGTGPLQPVGPFVSSTNATLATDVVFQAFLRPEESGNLTSSVLRRWERRDERRYRVQPLPDLRFADGTPVTTADLIGSLEAKGLRARAEGEWLEIEPNDPRAAVEPLLLFATVFKKTPQGFVGTGPFAIEESGEWRISLRRIHPAPGRISRVELLAFPSVRDAFARAIRGDADGAVGLDERQLELIEGIPRLKAVRGVGPVALAIELDPRRLDAATRRALADAIPLRDVGIAAHGDRCRIEGTPSPHGDLPAGGQLRIGAPLGDVGIDRASLALRRALGSRARGEIERDVLSAIMSPDLRSFDLLVTTRLVWPPEMIWMYWRSGAPWNFVGYSNDALDRAFERGDISTANAELRRDPPVAYLCRRERFAAIDARIKNPRLGWWGVLDLLPDWEVAQ